MSAAAALIAAGSSTFSMRVVTFGSALSSASLASLMSVAITLAPARENASTVALPMPCAAAVISVSFPSRLPMNMSFTRNLLPC